MSVSVSAPSLSLKVAEGRPQDAGRGLARLDPADMLRLGAGAGAIVQISGKKLTAAKVMPAFRDRRGREAVQIDGIAPQQCRHGDRRAGHGVGHRRRTGPTHRPGPRRRTRCCGP